MSMMKRMLSLLLALALLMGNIPAVAFAEETEIPAETEMVAAEETLAPTEAVTEPAETVTPTEVTTEPTVEETVAPTQPAVPEETAAPTEVEADLLEGTEPGEDALAGTSSVVASGICGDNLTWMLDDEGTLTISGTGTMTTSPWRNSYCEEITTVVIEDGVTSISNFAFGYCVNLRDVTIADTVTSINRFAFEGCHNLKEIALPNHLTAIGDGAFHNNSGLTSIKIPDSVTDLGEYVLELCDNLTNVTLPGKITSIPMMMFHGCSSLKTINIPDSVTNIGESAFGACWNLTSIYIPDGVTSIGDSAFWNCNSLTSVTIPDSVTSIGEHAFKDCDSLTEITFKGHAPEIGEDVFLEVIATAYYPANNPTWTADVMQNYGGRIIWKSYGGENEPTETEPEATEPDETEPVEDENIVASGTCGDNLTWTLDDEGTLTISGTGKMTNYGDTGSPWYSYRTSIRSAVIEYGVTSIGGNVFHGCSNLRSITIPVGVVSIGYGAFYECNNLLSITIPDSITSISQNAFSDCFGLTDVYITNMEAWLNISYYGGCANPLSMGSNTKLYLNNKLVTELVIPDTVTCIDSAAFYNCDSLTNVTIPDSVTSIDNQAFAYCDNLKSITIPDSVISIGSSAFADCNNLTNVTIPNSVVTIGGSVFHGCRNLEELVFMGDAPEFGGGVFYDVVAKAYYPTNNATWTEDVMQDYGGKIKWVPVGGDNGESDEDENIVASGTCGDNLTWTLENGVLTISGTGDMDSYNEEVASPWYAYRLYITSVMIEEGVTSIGDWAFLDCTQITSVEIPDSMTSIGEGAFNVCRGLTNITIPESVTSIGAFVFGYCSSLKKITFEGDMPAFGGTDVFEIVTATAYYPANNATWTADVMQDYGGTITWIPYTRESDPEDPTEPPTEEPTGPPTEVPTEPAVETPTEEPTEAPTEPVKDEIVVAAGTCGANLTWTLDDEGTLTISGTGPMKNYDNSGTAAPWDPTSYDINTVVIEDGVTTIGDNAFSWCESLSNFAIPDSVTKIGAKAFEMCTALTEVPIGNGVTSIGANAFIHCMGLTDIVIPDGVTYIGEGAFAGCNGLLSTVISDSVADIGDRAFAGCYFMKSIMLGSGLSHLGNRVFEGCELLEGIWVHKDNAYYSSDQWGILYNKDQSILIQAPEMLRDTYEIPDGVTSIGDHAFYECSNLMCIVIPDSVTHLGEQAFDECMSLKNVSIGSGLSYLGDQVFDGCASLEGIWVDEDNAFYCSDARGVLYNKNQSILIRAPRGLAGTYEIPEKVTSVYDRAFYKCQKLSSVVVPGSITSIGASTFSGCSSLKQLTICEGVSSIGDNAFGYCTDLRTIVVPKSLISFDEDAFFWSRSVQDIYYAGTERQWSKLTNQPEASRVHYSHTEPNGHFMLITVTGSCVLDSYTYEKCTCGYERNKVITNHARGHNFKKGVCTICKQEGIASGVNCGEYMGWTLDKNGKLTISGTGKMNDFPYHGAPWKDYFKSIKSVVIEKGITNIGEQAFQGCENLANVKIPDSVTSIGDYAFDSCYEKLKKITIPDSVTSIGHGAFESCYKLESINIPDGVTSIASFAFYDCYSLTSITLPAGITSIAYCTFANCESLTNIAIPDSVTSIEDSAFYRCLSLEKIVFRGNVPAFGGIEIFDWVTAKAYYPENNGTWTKYVRKNYGGKLTWKPYTLENGGNGEYDGDAPCVIASGSYDTNISWKLDNTYTLTISGTGEAKLDSSLEYCKGMINNVVIENGVTGISSFAFANSGVVSIEIPNSVTGISSSAFANSGVVSITIPNSVTYIGQGAFSGCKYLESITIPDSITTIKDGTFSDCRSLKIITIPDSVTRIESTAFASCDKLSKIVFKGDAPVFETDNENIGVFGDVTATAYYPLNNSTWTKDVRKNYGGKITWIEKCTNHTIVIQEATEVTCTTDGVTEGSYCSNCNEVLATQAVTPALGHNVEQWVIDRDTTYTVAGERHGNCERCGELVVETLDALGLPKPVVTVAANEKTGGGTLTWEHDGEADYYEVYRATSKSGKYKLLETVEGTELEVKVSVGKTYYYKVKAICDADASLNSGYSSVVKVTGKCAQPEIAVAPVPASGKPCVKGYEVSGAEEYEIYRSTNATEGFKKITTTSKTSYTDSKAELGMTYYYKVKAIASKSTYNSVFSEVDSCLTILAQPDAELSINTTTGKPVIEWEKVSGAIGYEILRTESEKGEYTKLANQTELTFEDTTADPDKDYWYKVNAIAENTDLNSIDVTGHQQMIHATLAQPKVTFGINSITGKPVMTWEEVDGAVEYKIYRSTKSTKSYKEIGTTEELSFSVGNASVGKGYYYKVIAIGENCKSAYSSYKKLTAKCAQPEITAIGADPAGGKPAVKWDKISGAKKYEVYRATEENGTYKKVKTTTSTSYTDSKAELGKTYYYKIKAIASKSTYNSIESAIRSCLTILAQPVVTAKNDAATGKPILSWKTVTGAVGYELYRSENGGEYELISTQTELIYTDENTVVDGQYTYKVKAIANDPALNSAESVEASIFCACAKPKAGIALDGKKPMVSWDSVEGATKYYVYRSTKKSSGYKKVATVELEDGESYTDSKAKKGTTYYYKIVAVSENTKSAYSNVVKIKSK